MKKIIYLFILLTFLTSCDLPFGSSSAPAETAPPAKPTAAAKSTATAKPTATEQATASVTTTASVESTASPEPAMTGQETDSVTATPSVTPTATGKPTATPSPTASATPTKTAEPTVTPSPTLSSVGVTNRCEILSGITITFVTLDWIYGEPLTFYFKIPGGVPGLERRLLEDSGVWSYYTTIGRHRTQECKFIEGYGERLYCSLDLPSSYNNTVQVLDLFVNGCDAAIYHDPLANMPKFVFKRGYQPDKDSDK